MSKIDSGNIYPRKINFEGHELIDELREKQAQSSFSLISKFLDEYPSILGMSKKQKGTSTYYNKRSPKDSKLDINKSLSEQFNLLRVVDNEKYPAFFHKNNQVYRIKIEKISQ